MPSKKGSKYLNAKTYSVLSKYTPEDIQKLLNSGQCCAPGILGTAIKLRKREFKKKI
jgi:hypothetical protein